MSRNWNRYSETLPREKIEELQLKRLRKLIKFAMERSRYYHDLYKKANIRPEDIKTWDDFYKKLPYTDKRGDNAMEPYQQRDTGPFGDLSALPLENCLYRFQTSGTTGIPFQIGLSYFDTLQYGEGWTYGLWRCGMNPGDLFYFAFPFGTFIGFWSCYWGVRLLGGTIRSGGGLNTEQRIKEIIELKPDAVVMTPTYAIYMGEKALEMGVDLRDAGVKLTVHAGEPGANVPSTRKKIAELWGATPWELYGIGEVNAMCPEMDLNSGGVHVCEPHTFTFVADPDTGEALAGPGLEEDGGIKGEHVIVSFAQGIQPVIKYRSHDIVEYYSTAPHETDCTWTFLKGGVLGRTDHMIIVKGVNVYITALENVATAVEGATPYYEVHVFREKGSDKLLIKIEAEDGLKENEYSDLENRIKTAVKEALRVGVEVDVLKPGSLPRYEQKSKKFFDHRKD